MKHRGLHSGLLILPALVFISATFLVPVLQLLVSSLIDTSGGGYRLTLQGYSAFFADAYGWQLLVRTLRISLFTLLACLVLAFPVALLMRHLSSGWRTLLAIVLLSPLLTSVVVRTLAWVVLLGPAGLLNTALAWANLGPVNLMYNEIGVIIGLTHVFFGYMLLTLAASVLKLDENLLLAAANLGASRWQIFYRILLPLSMPGIVSGAILVFTMSASAYIVPVLLGGTATKVMATEVYDLAIQYMEWKEAAVVATLLFLVMWLVVALLMRLVEPLRRAVAGREA